MSYSIAFLGTFHPAVDTLRALAERGWVKLIVLPEEAGSKNDDLLKIASIKNIPITYNINDIENYAIDLILAANYPKIVPTHLLGKYPCINTHWSFLPRYRGVHGTAWALINGDKEFGCSIHWMTDRFDEGDILAQVSVSMDSTMTINELHQQLANKQAVAVENLLADHLASKSWAAIKQNHSLATYVPMRLPEDGIINWEWPSERIWNLVRALPSPKYSSAYTHLSNQQLSILKAGPVTCPPYFCTPGQIVRVLKGQGVWVKTGDTCLQVEEVSLHGDTDKGPVPAHRLLKRGQKLGYQPQLELATLHQIIEGLKTEIEQLKVKIEN